MRPICTPTNHEVIINTKLQKTQYLIKVQVVCTAKCRITLVDGPCKADESNNDDIIWMNWCLMMAFHIKRGCDNKYIFNSHI